MDFVEFESMMDMSTSVASATSTRWERKAKADVSGSTMASSKASVDRFIPNRGGTVDGEDVSYLTGSDENVDNGNSDSSSDFNKLLTETTSGDSFKNDVGANTRVLAFKNKAPAPKEGYQNSLKVLYSQKASKKSDISKPTRHISSAPVRKLDAPEMLDDYYLNLLSWGPTNSLAVALSQYVYLWDANNGEIKELMNLDGDNSDEYVSSVAWLPQGGTHLAVGTSSSAVQLWDVEHGKQVRSMDGHSARVGALAWNNHILTSGSKDTTIINHDVRVQNHIVGKMKTHEQEVCGLAWSPDGQYLASGANDNRLCIWDLADSTRGNLDVSPRHVLSEHQAAVKALAWSPHERNLLASGGGTADRSIKFWNAQSGALLNSIDTGSQVCALQWSPHEKELLSSHGYAENQLCLWKYPTLAKIKELKAHTARVLHMATSPDGSMVCSGAADETLCFWNVFAAEGKKKAESTTSGALSRASGSLKIR
jgi:cell division cycle protein 20 (cofactor of APC complex)